MGRELNLLRSLPTRTVRDVAARRKDKARNRAVAMAFGKEYFDGPREQGYGGYRYDGRWIPVAKEIVSHFGLSPGCRVLDVGCAKGYLVKDLQATCLGLEVFGLDISEYAVSHCEHETRGALCVGTADLLPFPDNAFDAVICINTVHNLEPDRCVHALHEIERLAPGRGFVQVDAYRTEEERLLFEDWMLTAKTYRTPDGWLDLFREARYGGSYFWTILEANQQTVVR